MEVGSVEVGECEGEGVEVRECGDDRVWRLEGRGVWR